MTDIAIRKEVTLEEIVTLGRIFAKSGYFLDAREEAQAVVKILCGRELGIEPMAAMSGIAIVKGRPQIGANLMAALIRKSGVYDYRLKRLDEQGCEIEFLRGPHTLGVSSFTRKDAEAAGLAGGENWKKYFRNMAFARAMSNGAKWYCPDVFAGQTVYAPGELGGTEEAIDIETGEVLSLPPAEAPPAQQPVPSKNGKAVPPITATPAFRALMAWMRDEQIAEEPFKRFLSESGVLPVDEQGELHWAALSEVNLRGVLGKKEGCLARFRPFSEMLAHLQGEGIDMERFRDFLSTIIPTEAGKILSLATLPQELHAALPGAIHDYRIWEGEGDAVEEMENEEF